MRVFGLNSIAVAGLLLAASGPSSHAQTVGYADSLGLLGRSCNADIAKYCKNVNLGSGKMIKCLGDKNASISPACRGSHVKTSDLLRKGGTADGYP